MSKQKKRVLLLGEPIANQVSGIVAVVKQMLSNDELNANYKFTYVGFGSRKSKLNKYFSWIIGWIKFLYYVPFNDVVYIHHASNTAFKMYVYIVQISKSIFRKKLILHNHGGDFIEFYERENLLWQQKIIKALDKADKLIFLTHEQYDYFSKLKLSANSLILSNGVKVPEQLFEKDSECCQLLFLGRIEPLKGISVLLEALTLVDRKALNFKLILAGNIEKEYKNEIVAYIEANQLQDIIDFPGVVAGTKKQELLKKADIFVLPSLLELLPISLLEGMAYQAAPIATNVGYISSVIKNDENGILIEPNDSKALADAITTLVTSSAKRKMLGNNAYQCVLTDFNESNQMKKVSELICEILDNEQK